MLSSSFEMKRSTNTVYKLLTNVLLLILACRASNAQNDFIVKSLSNQVDFLLRQLGSFSNDIEQLTEKLDMEISTRKKLTEKVLFTEAFVIIQQREIGKIKAHLLKEHDRNRYLLHNNTLLATELKRLRKGLTGEKKQRYILTNALVDLQSDVKQLSNSNGSSLFVNCCKYYPDCNHSDSIGTKNNNTDSIAPTEKVCERVIKSSGVTFSGDPINSKDEREALDCRSIYKLKYRKDGVYRIRLSADETVNLYCVLEDSDYRGLLVIQRRKNGTLNFDRSWTDYQNGFGDFGGDFWLGNEILFRLSNLGQSRLYIMILYYVKSHNHEYWFLMGQITLRNATQGYQLLYGARLNKLDNGNMGPISRSYFATKDNTSFRDARCPPVNGGWWYTTFPQCNLRYSNPNSRYTTLTTEDGEQYLGFNAPKGGINITESEILMYSAGYSD